MGGLSAGEDNTPEAEEGTTGLDSVLDEGKLTEARSGLVVVGVSTGVDSSESGAEVV